MNAGASMNKTSEPAPDGATPSEIGNLRNRRMTVPWTGRQSACPGRRDAALALLGFAPLVLDMRQHAFDIDGGLV